MTRLEAMERYLKPFIVDRVKAKIHSVKDEKDDSICQAANNLLLEAAKRQQICTWIPTYLAVFHLNSSLVTGTYEYQICLMDEQMYLDRDQIEIYWKPGKIYADLDQETELIKKELRKKFVRITEYEVCYLFRQLIKEYKKVTEVSIRKSIQRIIKEQAFEELKKKNPFIFLYGDYMGEIKQIFKYEGGSSDVR